MLDIPCCSEELHHLDRSFPVLEGQSQPSVRALDGIGPRLLACSSELHLDAALVPQDHQVHGTVTDGLRVGDVVPLSDDLACPTLLQSTVDPIELLPRLEDRTASADVLEAGQLAALHPVQLAHETWHPLQALRHHDVADLGVHHAPETHGDLGQRVAVSGPVVAHDGPGVVKPAPVDRSGVRVFLEPTTNGDQVVAAAVDLTLAVREGRRASHAGAGYGVRQ